MGGVGISFRCNPSPNSCCGSKWKEWRPMASAGIIPTDSSMMQTLSNIPTPILDRFLPTARGGASTKESYLPTLQALPGKTELKYLPPNAQEALILPIRAEGDAELESV